MQATIFGLTVPDNNSGVLTFQIIDSTGETLQLYSTEPEADSGNEPVFFATDAYLDTLALASYIVGALVNPDCSIDLILVNDNQPFGDVIAECRGVLYLLTEQNAIASGCTLVILQLEPVPIGPPTTPTCIDGFVPCPQFGTNQLGCVDLPLDPENCGACGVVVSTSLWIITNMC